MRSAFEETPRGLPRPGLPAAEEIRSSWRQRLLGCFTYTPRTFALAWKLSPIRMVTIMVLTIFTASQSVMMVWVGKKLVDSVMHARENLHKAPDDQALARVVHWMLIEIGLLVGMQLCDRLLLYFRGWLESKLDVEINVLIIRKALLLDFHHFENSEFNDKLTRAKKESSSRPLSLIQGNLQVARSMLTMLGYGALLLHYSRWSVLCVLVAVMPSAIYEARFSRKIFKFRKWITAEKRQVGYIESVATNYRFVKEAKLFGLGPLLLERYQTKAESLEHKELHLKTEGSIWRFFISLISSGAFYIYYIGVALAAATARLTLGDMTLYLAAFQRCQAQTQAVLLGINGLYDDNLYMSNLYEFLDLPAQKTLPTSPRRSLVSEHGIRFESVGFRYPDSDKWALRDFSVFIPHGTSVALVGENGAGKTTVIKLLSRLYDFTEGRVLLDGCDLRSWELSELWHRMSVIFQDFNQYEFLARDNVAFGDVEHLADDARIWRALERGGADKIISGLPDGLETQLGKSFQNGKQLSGGQWQKVALSRAFMRESADILILDEPTAALDAVAESAIFERFSALAKGRTAIFISHRFPTVRMADRILVLDQGRLIEEGTHNELVSAGGQYARMFELQASGYR